LNGRVRIIAVAKKKGVVDVETIGSNERQSIFEYYRING